MITFLAVVACTVLGFLGGLNLGTKWGYDQAYDRAEKLMSKLEKIYRGRV